LEEFILWLDHLNNLSDSFHENLTGLVHEVKKLAPTSGQLQQFEPAEVKEEEVQIASQKKSRVDSVPTDFIPSAPAMNFYPIVRGEKIKKGDDTVPSEVKFKNSKDANDLFGEQDQAHDMEPEGHELHHNGDQPQIDDEVVDDEINGDLNALNGLFSFHPLPQTAGEGDDGIMWVPEVTQEDMYFFDPADPAKYLNPFRFDQDFVDGDEEEFLFFDEDDIDEHLMSGILLHSVQIQRLSMIASEFRFD